MFVDKATINLKAGDGGDGIIAFRREKYVPAGGPAGGDGGNGGNIIFRVDEGLRTLMDFRYKRHFKADRGVNGRNKTMHGANADDLIVRVPPGTVVTDEATQEIIADLTLSEEERVIVHGGRGGRGNARFATPVNSAPDIAENGEAGQELTVTLELKVIADVGLVGFPSVGKSTLLSVVSAAQPKIAAYHFTTLSPNLGVVAMGDERSFVMADLPGLIEGAHQGHGLGHEFLRHIERTRIIVHIIDISASEGRDPYEDWLKINEELKQYSSELQKRPQIIVANKMDMLESANNLRHFRAKLHEFDGHLTVFPISAATQEGVQLLLYRIADLLDELPKFTELEQVVDKDNRKIYKLEKDGKENEFIVRRENEGYVVESVGIEKLIKRSNLNSPDAILRFARILRSMGVDSRLRELGAEDGQTVRIGNFEFEFQEKG